MKIKLIGLSEPITGQNETHDWDNTIFSRTNESITCRDRQTSETCSGLIGWRTLDRSLIANQTRDWDNTVYSSRIRSQWTNLSRDAIDRPVSLCGRLIVWRPRADHWTDRWSAAADCDCDRGDCLPTDWQPVPTPYMAGVHSVVWWGQVLNHPGQCSSLRCCERCWKQTDHRGQQ